MSGHNAYDREQAQKLKERTEAGVSDVDVLVSRFNVGGIWLSPMHTYYRVEETNETTGQAVLRMGLQGNYRRIRRPITATKNWTFVAPALTGELLDSVCG